jgi:hypothetical protein
VTAKSAIRTRLRSPLGLLAEDIGCVQCVRGRRGVRAIDRRRSSSSRSSGTFPALSRSIEEERHCEVACAAEGRSTVVSTKQALLQFSASVHHVEEAYMMKHKQEVNFYNSSRRGLAPHVLPRRPGTCAWCPVVVTHTIRQTRVWSSAPRSEANHDA